MQKKINVWADSNIGIWIADPYKTFVIGCDPIEPSFEELVNRLVQSGKLSLYWSHKILEFYRSDDEESKKFAKQLLKVKTNEKF